MVLVREVASRMAIYIYYDGSGCVFLHFAQRQCCSAHVPAHQMSLTKAPLNQRHARLPDPRLHSAPHLTAGMCWLFLAIVSPPDSASMPVSVSPISCRRSSMRSATRGVSSTLALAAIPPKAVCRGSTQQFR